MFGKDCGRHGTRVVKMSDLCSKKTWRNQNYPCAPTGDESAFSGSKLRLVSFESYQSNQSHDRQVSMKLNNGLYKPEVSWRKKFSGFLAIGHFSFLKKPVSQSMPLNLEIGDLRVAVAEGVAIAEACCIHVFSKFCLLGKPWIEDGELGGGFVKDFLFNSPGELIQFDSYKWVETTN